MHENNQKVPTELGTENIGKLLRQYSVPAMIAMVASSLYNMVDSIFIGRGVGAMAISGLAITFPLMNLAAAFGTLVGVGGATLVSVKLGQKDYRTSKLILGNVILLNIIIGIAVSLVTIPFLDPILYFFGASENTISYARDYMLIILIGNAPSHLYFGLNAMLRSSGHPRQAMYATLASELLNTVLDPLFIFGFSWGIQGAAIATVLSQVITLVYELWLFSNKSELIHIEKDIFHLRRDLVVKSLSIGLSPFLMNLASCVVVILINQGLKRHGGDMAIGAYGLANRLTFVIFMFVMGLNQGMQPIAGYNFGAQRYDRVTKVLKLTIFYATIFCTVGTAVCVLFPETLARIFTKDPQLIAKTVVALRVTLLCFPLVGFQAVTTNFFQSIGMAHKAIFLSLTRQLLYLVPFLIAFPMFWGEMGVWASMPASDFCAILTAAVMLFFQFKSFKKMARTDSAA